MEELLEWLEEYRVNTMSLMAIGDYEQGQIDVLTDVINRVDPNRCSYCGQKDGNHKMSCPTTKSVVYLEEHRKRKQALMDMMQADEKDGLYNKAIPMEIKHLVNDVYQVVQNGTVWFQGDLLDCHAYKNKHEDE